MAVTTKQYLDKEGLKKFWSLLQGKFAPINSGVTSFGGKTGGITIDTSTTTDLGHIKFTMSDTKLTGTAENIKGSKILLDDYSKDADKSGQNAIGSGISINAAFAKVEHQIDGVNETIGTKRQTSAESTGIYKEIQLISENLGANGASDVSGKTAWGAINNLQSSIKTLNAATSFVGTTTTVITDGVTTNITVTDKPDYEQKSGDIVAKENDEYIFDGKVWRVLGNTTGLATDINNIKDGSLTVKNTEYASHIGTNSVHPAIGTLTKPVYVNDAGEIKECTHTLEANVPSSAEFTDTKYVFTEKYNEATAGELNGARDLTFSVTPDGSNAQTIIIAKPLSDADIEAIVNA